MTAHTVAIDGPSACGKSTVAKKVASALAWLHVDSGAVYRAVTWCALRRGIACGDGDALDGMLDRTPVEFFVRDHVAGFRMDGVEPGDELRSEEVTRNVSHAASHPRVRARVVAWLRGTTRLGNVVMEGRDIGTVVFPHTPLKFYLDASPGERARRRHAEVSAGGRGPTAAEVGDALARRDRIDSTRSADPLKVAPGALVVDTTNLSAQDVADLILVRVRAVVAGAGEPG